MTNTIATIGALGALAVLGAAIPADKETLSIDHTDAPKYGAVKLEHAKHMERNGPDGSPITCQSCHHTLAEGAEAKDVKTCISCHVEDGGQQVEHGGKKAPFYFTNKSPGKPDLKSIVLHKSCTDGCHKGLAADVKKKLRKCTACHEKN